MRNAKYVIVGLVVATILTGCSNQKDESDITNTRVETQSSEVIKEEVTVPSKKLATYDDIDAEVLKDIDKKNQDVIKNQVESKTTHMMWQLTGKEGYLLSTAEENVEDIKLLEEYWLEGDDNYLYFLYEVTIKTMADVETGYMLFEYKDSIVSGDTFIVNTNNIESRYTCGQDKTALISDVIECKGNLYEVKMINNL